MMAAVSSRTPSRLAAVARAVATLAAVLVASLALWRSEAAAIIDPRLQPVDLFRRYELVTACRVVSVQSDRLEAQLEVLETFKGDSPTGGKVVIEASEELAGTLRAYRGGDRLVVFAGRPRPISRRDEVLVYDGGWLLGRREGERWKLERPADRRERADGGPEETKSMMAGTFNGDVDWFRQLMADLRDSHAYLPARPHAAFAADVLLDQLDGEVVAVSLADLDGDGRLDIHAASLGGDRAYLQLEDMEFTVASDVLGLGGMASRWCAIADVDADGDVDLLADGRLFLADGGIEGRFRAAGALPGEAPDTLAAALFAEYDGDGAPDIVALRSAEAGGGLALFANVGDGHFEDSTEAAGLDRESCGRGLVGAFCAGDWNDNGRCDLFLAAGGGLLLVQDAGGRFAPWPHRIPLDFAVDDPPSDLAAPTGAGAFAAILGSGRLDLVVPTDGALHLIANRDGSPTDVTGAGNEISEASLFQLGTLAEDLNADGHVDLYTWTRKPGRSNRLHLYRGYGTFMNATKYAQDIFSGPTHEFGGVRSAAAGDLNGDGANDLVLGGSDGALTLLVNDCLAGRVPEPHPTAEAAALLATGRVTVELRPERGVTGARVVIRSRDGRMLGRRDLPGGSTRACLAIRTPGVHRLEVRYADGLQIAVPVEVTAGTHRRVQVTREPPDEGDAPGRHGGEDRGRR